jgi:TPR repeat protein
MASNETKGVSWLTKAALAGEAHAQYNLGVMYSQGMGGGVDPDAAVRWWRMAAEQGDGKSCFALGSMYMRAAQRLEGAEEEQATKAASAWFKQGADLGHGTSLFMFARALLSNIGKGTDVSKAWRLLSRAAKQQVQGAAELLERLEAATKRTNKPDADPAEDDL